MPDRDGGHYFLTAFLPVRAAAVQRDDGSVTAPSHALREALASLPTAAQSATSMASDSLSPFARCTRTHFARLFVLDQPAFNGRDPTDALIGHFKQRDLLAHRPVDCLGSPWLVLIVDFDEQAAEADGGLASYLHGIWGAMEPELRAILLHCHGFEQVTSAETFADYVRRCQIETTMPFNDYWTGAPPLSSISLGQFGAILGGLTLAIVAVEVLLFRWAHIGLGWLGLGVPLAIPLAAFLLQRFVAGRSAKPFPTAPGSDLPNVLKALYVQQAFARFAIEHQGCDAVTLHAKFGDFLGTVRPGDLAPTRLAGRIAA